MFGKKPSTKKSEDVKKSSSKVLDPKRDTPTRCKHLRFLLDNSESSDIHKFMEVHYSQVFYIVYDAFIFAETNLRSKGAHKAQREELEAVLYLLENVLIYLPEQLHKKWQIHSMGRLMSKLLHPGNSWKLLKKEAMRLFLLWYQILGDSCSDTQHAMFATLVPGFPSPYPGLGLTALAAQTSDTVEGVVTPTEIFPLIPPQNVERLRSSPDSDLTRIFLDVLLELIVSQVGLIEWKENKMGKQKSCLSFLFEQFKTYYMPHIFTEFNWKSSLYKPSLELPEVRIFRPSFIESGDGTKKIDPMLACRVVVIKWIGSYTQEQSEETGISNSDFETSENGNLVRELLYGSRNNVNFVHEVYRQAFLLSFSHSPAIKKAISVYKDWITMSSEDSPSFLLEPIDAEREEFQNALMGEPSKDFVDFSNNALRAGLQNVLQVFVTNAANVFLLEISSEYPILLDEQVEMCKRVLNIYRYMVMNVKMEGRTWEQLLFILLQVTQLTLSQTPPRRREEVLGGRLSQAIFQTLIVTWIKANLYVVVSSELWDQFLEVLSSLTLWEELIREWAKTMETLTRVLARQVYHLDLMDLPLDRLSERAAKKKRGKAVGHEIKYFDKFDNKSNCEVVERSSGPSSLVVTSSVRHHSNTNQSHHPHHSHSNHHHKKNNLRRSLSEGNLSTYHYVHISTTRPCKSVDSLYFFDSESRSTSPARSSSNDSPMQFDPDNLSEGVMSELNNGGDSEPRSVMSGGSIKGWLPDVVVVLWRRMLGSLGNINSITDTVIHAQIYKYLIELFDVIVKIRSNQGVTTDNLSTPPSPEYVPPITIFAPWCFRALNLPESYQRGRLYALRLLCLMTNRPHDNPLPKTHLVQFYKVLHSGLTTSKLDVMTTLLRFTGPRFFSLMLPGYTAYILDFLYAANAIISTTDVKSIPRTEATSTVGSLLAFPRILSNMPLLLPNSNELSLISSADVKDQIIGVLLKSGKKEPLGIARCISLSSLGIFVYSELIHKSFHPKLKEAISVLVSALRFISSSTLVAAIASDMLLLLVDHVDIFLTHYPEVPKKIVAFLARTLLLINTDKDKNEERDTEERKRYIYSLLLCLGEWCMRLPLHILTESSDEGSLLETVFAALQLGMETCQSEREKEENQEKKETNEKKKEKNESSIDSLFIFAPIYRAIYSHLTLHLFHFPLELGASNLSALISEHDDVSSEYTLTSLNAPNVQLLVINHEILLSFIELPQEKQTRLLFRNLSGKFSWDASALVPQFPSIHSSQNLIAEQSPSKRISPIIKPSSSLYHRNPHILPLFENMEENNDNLDDLLRYLNLTSPELCEVVGKPLNSPSLFSSIEKDLSEIILSQKKAESKVSSTPTTPPPPTTTTYSNNNSIEMSKDLSNCSEKTFEEERILTSSHDSFNFSRLFFSQLGFSSWENRPKIHLLKKTDKLLRELKNLDNISSRETHKIAVIYVAAGQEDRQSILSNSTGSPAYEEFVSGLGWEVELESHKGFMAGLTKNKMTGETAPYYATSFVEVMFHVSTRMPSQTQESFLQKTRHLGNDEIHIVWSEHYRDYRRGILPTEFCDVLIIIYPLKNKLYRIQVSRKPEISYFGPLFNEMIVDGKSLPGLVRATSINASRTKRFNLPYFLTHYEERAKALDGIISNHKLPLTHEDFITDIFSPSPLVNLFQSDDFRPRSFTEGSLSGKVFNDDEDEDHENPSPRNLKKTLKLGRSRPSSIREEEQDTLYIPSVKR